MMSQRLDRPIIIRDNIIWDLLLKMLSFDQKKRISASDALKHPFFTGEQAMKEISPLSIELAQSAEQSKQSGNNQITQYETESSYSLHISDIKQVIYNNLLTEMNEIQKQFLISPQDNIYQTEQQPQTKIPSSSQLFPNQQIQFSLPPTEQISLEQLKLINQQINSLKDVEEASLDLFNQHSNALFAVRSTQVQEQERISDEINKLNQEIICNVSQMIKNIIKKKEDADLASQTNIIIELIDIIKRIPVEKITKQIIGALGIICEYGSAQQTHQLFQIGIIQILTTKLNNNNKEIQIYILWTLINIIQQGWQQIQQLQQQSSSQLHIQQLLNPSLPHPYLAQLEQQQIIITIIQDIIFNDESDMENRKIAFELLDALYSEGIKLPSNLQQQIIKYFCDQSKSNEINNRGYALQSLSYISINQDNHDLIISEGAFETVSEYIEKKSQGSNVDFSTLNHSLDLLLNLFIFGSKQTQQIIQNSITKETLNEIIKYQSQINQFDEFKYLLNAYAYPDQMKEIVQIGRIAQSRSEEQQIELAKAGLLNMMNEMIEKAISKEEGEGEIIYIGGKILSHLIYNQYNKEIINELSSFYDNILHLLKSLSINKVKSGYLNIFYNHLYDINNELNQKLFEKGIIQSMIKMQESSDKDVREEVSWIILNVIKLGAKELEEGQQHPFYQQLSSDGTISKLIQQFKNKKDKDIHDEIAQTIAYLFRTLPLPPDIRKDIIEKLKIDSDFDELAFTAECQDNHDAILNGNYENQIFKYESDALKYLQLIYHILKYGSNKNKKKVALAVKVKVERLLIDEYLDELIEKYYWNEQKIKEIKPKAKEVLSLIKTVEESIEYEGEFEEINSQNIWQNKQE